ncbi:hypothetical protein ABAC460_15665 [Asticcacaulis sp. AC460]|uniref:OmpA family protein n=1 Tax=Asticcacaulis sp. AC460 TaxID=1282360 RepID=UPI0003C3DAA5|nr:OmpA family protein [Asticcacaulis sp. AC460]ESQ88469.1 hypothetical protein ABAC460_15665 [Asticcacaulis sp. AC460]
MFRRIVLAGLAVATTIGVAAGVFLWKRFDETKDCPTYELRDYIAYFVPDSSELSPDAIQIIDELAASTKYYDPCLPVDRITLVAHTDTVGDTEANLRLARRRVEAVAARLKMKGVTLPLRLVPKGEANTPVPTADNVREPLNNRVYLDYLS